MRPAIAAAFVLLFIGCGTLQGPRTGTISPPADALARWKDFPADQVPRPIVMLEIPPRHSGFTSGDGKFAALCNKYTLAFQPSTQVPASTVATWADGTHATLAPLSAVDAYAAITGAQTGMTSAQCASVTALVVTGVRLGLAGFRTDRGTAQMSSWLWTVTGSTGDIAYPAIATSAFWGRPRAGVPFNVGGTVSADGRTLTYAFVGGECDAGYKSAVAESPSAVAVAVVAIPKAGGMYQACSAVGIFRTVSVSLASPLGGRVVVNASGEVEAVCPAAVGRSC